MEELIRQLKKMGVVQKRKVILTSGRRSDFYIDMKKAYGQPAILKIIADELSKIISPKATCIAVLGHGGIPLGTVVSQKLNLPLAMVREKPKGYGMNNLIDGYVPKSTDKVAVLDDVFTTGKSVRKIVTALKITKAQIAGKYVAVNRSGKKKIRCRYLLDVSVLT